MRKLILLFAVVPLLSSCYAFMKADKLVYAGTIAKRPVQITVDSVFNTEVETNAFEK